MEWGIKMRKIRVVILVPSLVVGGAENMVAQLLKNIDKEKNDVLLIVMSSKNRTYINALIEGLGIKLIYMNKKDGFSLNAFISTFKILTKFKPQIIHTHLSSWVYAFLWGLIYGVNILHTIHSMPIRECTGAARILRKYLYKMNSIIPVAISDMIAKQTSELYNLPAGFIETIYNPVDIQKFQDYKEYTNKQYITFVNVARFTAIKNQTLLVDAFYRVQKELPNTLLVLVGDGELRTQVEEKVRKLHLEEYVTFTGIISGVSDILAQSDIFVLPSDYEGLPLTILEAMAAGLPIIASSVGGIPDIVKDNGILIEPGNKEELVLAMIELAKSSEDRKKMSEIAKKEVKKYDISKVTIKYEKLYKKYAKI